MADELLADAEKVLQTTLPRPGRRSSHAVLKPVDADDPRPQSLQQKGKVATATAADKTAALNAVLVAALDEASAADTAALFSAPVDTEVFPDYAAHVDCPMDLGTMRAKALARGYASVADFNADCTLISANAHAYNDASNPAVAAKADSVVLRQPFPSPSLWSTLIPQHQVTLARPCSRATSRA